MTHVAQNTFYFLPQWITSPGPTKSKKQQLVTPCTSLLVLVFMWEVRYSKVWSPLAISYHLRCTTFSVNYPSSWWAVTSSRDALWLADGVMWFLMSEGGFWRLNGEWLVIGWWMCLGGRVALVWILSVYRGGVWVIVVCLWVQCTWKLENDFSRALFLWWIWIKIGHNMV